MRIQIGPYVMKTSGVGYLVGRSRMRVIKGAVAEEVYDRHYVGSQVTALEMLILLASSNGAQAETDLLFTREMTRLVALGPRLRRMRMEAGLTQRQVGGVARLSERHVRRIENGHVTPRADTVVRIVRALERGR